MARDRPAALMVLLRHAKLGQEGEAGTPSIIQVPPSQGQYLYQRVNGLSAEVQLTPTEGQSCRLRLTFSSPTQGTFEEFDAFTFGPFSPSKTPTVRPDSTEEFTIIQ